MQKIFNRDGFNWWIGVVEDRMDPLGLGRCKVRIFGWYDTGDIPTDELPWAHPVLSINSPSSGTTLFPGEWVVGFFADNEGGQFPLVFGKLPGLAQSNL